MCCRVPIEIRFMCTERVVRACREKPYAWANAFNPGAKEYARLPKVESLLDIADLWEWTRRSFQAGLKDTGKGTDPHHRYDSVFPPNFVTTPPSLVPSARMKTISVFRKAHINVQVVV